MMTGISTRTRQHEGAVLVEFALSLPLMLLVLVGILDFGFLFREQQVVTNAAREGARMAVLGGYNASDVKARVVAYMAAGGVPATADDAQVLWGITTGPAPCPPTAAAPPAIPIACVIVTVNHSFTYLGPIATLVGGSFGSTVLRGVAVMRTEMAAGGV
jgi:hypothetical protein